MRRGTGCSFAKNKYLIWSLGAVSLVVFGTEIAGAFSADGTLVSRIILAVREAFTGPVAFGISVVWIAVTGAILVFCNELSRFARWVVILVLLISTIVMAANFINEIFIF